MQDTSARSIGAIRTRIRVRIRIRSLIHDGHVLEASPHCLRLSTDGIVAIWRGDAAEIDCPGAGTIRGTVRWRKPGSFEIAVDTSAESSASLKRFLALPQPVGSA